MKISILGTGAYGMALASIFDYNKCNVMMWTNSKEEMELLINSKKSDKVDYVIPNNFVITTDIKSVVESADIIVIAVPAKFTHSVCSQFKDYYRKEQVICIASKGIEQDTCLFLYDVVKNTIKTKPVPYIGLKGPYNKPCLFIQIPFLIKYHKVSKINPIIHPTVNNHIASLAFGLFSSFIEYSP